jgi:transcription factor SPN1
MDSPDGAIAPVSKNQAMASKLQELAERKRKEQVSSAHVVTSPSNSPLPTHTLTLPRSLPLQEEEKRREIESHRAKRLRELSPEELRDFEIDQDEDQGEEEEPGSPTTRGGDETHPPPPAAEDNFIDDTGVPLDERVNYGAELFEDEDDEDLRDDNDGYAEDEAEDEEDDFDAVLRPNSKRRKEDLEDNNKIQKEVDIFLSQLDTAYELDVELINHNKPAIHKLRTLRTVREKLSMKRLHDQLLEHNLLGHLERWLHPLDGGILPNTSIRSTMLEFLGVLPIDCSNEVRRQQLKDSGLGKLVMFYYKLPDETAENKKLAKQLIDKWSRPMLASKSGVLGEEEERKMLEGRRARNEAQKKVVQASQNAAEREREREEMKAGAAAAGGRRGGLATAAMVKQVKRHTAIPQRVGMDYIKKPETRVAYNADKGGGRTGGGEHKLTKKLRTLGKKTTRQAANVSVEGRNVNVQNH